jgi:ketosteroid isomerase-like protein
MTRADDVAAEIRQAEDRRFAAMLAGDVDALSQLLSDRLVYTHSTGSRDTKQSLLSKMADGSLTYLSIDHPVEQVIVLGDAVLVIGEMRAEVVLEGVARRLNNSALAVWAYEQGQWRLAAYQPTPLPVCSGTTQG